MIDSRLTASEIIKILAECFSKDYRLATVYNKNTKEEAYVTLQNIIDALNSQSAETENYKRIAEHQQSVSMDKEVEIKRLKAEVEQLQKENHLFADIGKMYSEVKAETAKEIMERLIDKAWDADTRCGYVQVVDVGDIEDVCGEMVGESNV